MALCDLAKCYYRLGDVKSAHIYINRGYKLSNSVNTLEGQGFLLFEFAKLKYLLAKYMHELTIYGTRGKKEGRALPGTAELYHKRYTSELESCKKKLNKAAEFYKSDGNVLSLACVYQGIGDIESDLLQLHQARDSCNRCLSLARANKWGLLECESLIKLAGIATQEQQFREAEGILSSIESLCKEIDDNALKGTYYCALFELHEAIPGAMEKAIGELLLTAWYRNLNGNTPDIEVSRLKIESIVKKIGKKKFSIVVEQAGSRFKTNFHPLLSALGIPVT